MNHVRYSSKVWIWTSSTRRRVAVIALMTVMLISGVSDVARAQSARQGTPRLTGDLTSERAFLNEYCVSCHNTKLKNPAGALALDTVDLDNVNGSAALWEKVVRKLHARAMPPPGPGRRRPDDDAYGRFISYVETSLDREALRKPAPGRSETFHRLNRAQYRNAIRDLLALDIDVTGMLPTDDASHGFDNVNVSGLSPTLVEQYLSASRKITRLAIGMPPRSADARTVVLPLDYTQDYHVEGLPYGTRGGTMFEHNFPVDGEYLFQVRLSRNRDEQIEGFNEPLTIEIALDGERLQVFSLTPNRPERGPGPAQEYMTDESDVDAGLKGRFPVKAGPHTVTAAFLKRPGLPETARQPFKADYNGRSMAAIFSVTVAGPYNPGAPGQTPSRERVFVCQPSKPSAELGCAKTIVERLARRAYRRQLADADREKLLNYYREGRAEGGTFERGIEMALRAILASPDFLFRIERDPERCRRRNGVSAQRCRTGFSSVVLPLEQHSRRSAARSCDWRQASESPDPRTAGSPHVGGQAFGGTGRELRRAVALPAQSGCSHS